MPLTILYAEDHATVRLALKETLEREGWRVDACADGLSALVRLEGGESYALLVFDKDLPDKRRLYKRQDRRNGR
jgi:CheY-like chemotaxis protein